MDYTASVIRKLWVVTFGFLTAGAIQRFGCSPVGLS